MLLGLEMELSVEWLCLVSFPRSHGGRQKLSGYQNPFWDQGRSLAGLGGIDHHSPSHKHRMCDKAPHNGMVYICRRRSWSKISRYLPHPRSMTTDFLPTDIVITYTIDDHTDMRKPHTLATSRTILLLRNQPQQSHKT